MSSTNDESRPGNNNGAPLKLFFPVNDPREINQSQYFKQNSHRLSLLLSDPDRSAEDKSKLHPSAPKHRLSNLLYDKLEDNHDPEKVKFHPMAPKHLLSNRLFDQVQPDVKNNDDEQSPPLGNDGQEHRK